MDYFAPVKKESPLLQSRLAHAVSRCTVATRLSLKLAGVVVESALELGKFSAETGFGISKRGLKLVRQALFSIEDPDSSLGNDGESKGFIRRYTTLGIYIVHSAFSLAEYLTLGILDGTRTGLRFSLTAADELVYLLDCVFGCNETSTVLSSFIGLVTRDLQDCSPKSQGSGAIVAIKYITKTFVCFACLQNVVSDCKPVQRRLVMRVMPSSQQGSTNVDDECSSSPHHKASVVESIRSNAASLRGLLNDYTSSERERARDQKTRMKLFLNIDLSSSDCDSGDESEDQELTPKASRMSRSLQFDYADYSRGSEFLPTNQKQLLEKKSSRLSIRTSIFSRASMERSGKADAPNLSTAELSRQIKRLARCCRIATAAYGEYFMTLMGVPTRFSEGNNFETENQDWRHRNIVSFSKYSELAVADIVSSSFHRQQRQKDRLGVAIKVPKVDHVIYYLAVDHELTSIILALRGTLGLNDLFIDLTCAYSELWVDTVAEDKRTEKSFVGLVHSGMLKSATLLLDPTGPIFVSLRQAMRKWPSYSVCLTGHSLGAGVASLLALLMSKELPSGQFVTNSDTGLFGNRPIHCYAYGPPAVMAASLSDRCKQLITSVVVKNDMVPNLSLGTIFDFRRLARVVESSPQLDERVTIFQRQILKEKADKLHMANNLFTSENTKAFSDADANSLYEELRSKMTMTKLYPPGKILWILSETPEDRKSTSSWVAPFKSAFFAIANGRGSSQQERLENEEMVSLYEIADIEAMFGIPNFTGDFINNHNPNTYNHYLSILSSRF